MTRYLPLALVTISREGEVLYRNPAATSVLGADREGANALEALLRSLGSGPWIGGVFEGRAFTREETIQRREGEAARRVLKVTGVPVTRGDRPVEALLLVEDVTDLKDTQELLIRSEERYRNIFNHAACGIFFVDTKGNYLDANPAALEMLGYTLDELLALNTREVSSASEERIRRLKAATDWIMEEVRYLRKDGRVVEAQIAASSFRSGAGTYFIGITTDLTEKRSLERRLSAERRNIATLVEAAEDPILAVSGDGGVVAASPSAAALLGTDLVRARSGFVILTEPAAEEGAATARIVIPPGPPMTHAFDRLEKHVPATESVTTLIRLGERV